MKKIFYLLVFIFSVSLFLFLLIPSSVHATTTPTTTSAKVGGDELNKLQAEAKKILNPVGFGAGSQGVFEIIGKAIQFFIFAIGMIAMAFYIWGGFLWMTASGNAENVKKAQTILVWTTLGVVATLGSYLIVNFVFGIL